MKIAVIPARGGSTRIPRKNIRNFHGKPILAYSIECARRSRLFNYIYVSSEDREILDVGMRYGAQPLPRPAHLAEVGCPDCGTQEVARHALEHVQGHGYKVDFVCCIYPCAPLMTASELGVGLKAVRQEDAHYAFAAGENPLRDAGQWYWSKAWPLLARTPMTLAGADSYKIVIPDERVCDINTEEDWARAEELYRQFHQIKEGASA